MKTLLLFVACLVVKNVLAQTPNYFADLDGIRYSLFFDTLLNRADALAVCEGLAPEGTLAQVTSSAIRDHLKTTMSITRNVWISCNALDDATVWVRTDGSSCDKNDFGDGVYSNWNTARNLCLFVCFVFCSKVVFVCMFCAGRTG